MQEFGIIGKVARDAMLCGLINLVGDGLGYDREHRIAVGDGVGRIAHHGNHVVGEPLAVLALDASAHLECRGDIVFQIPACATAHHLRFGNLHHLGLCPDITPIGDNELGKVYGRTRNGLAATRQRISHGLRRLLVNGSHDDGIVECPGDVAWVLLGCRYLCVHVCLFDGIELDNALCVACLYLGDLVIF